MANTDTWAFFALVLFFLTLGTLLPFISAAFSQDSITQDISGLPKSPGDLTYNPVTFLDVFLSIMSVFFWTFGQVYWVIDILILLPLRILAVYLFIRMVRGI